MTEDEVQAARRVRLAAWLEAAGGPSAVCKRRGLARSVESHISQILGGYSFGSRAARSMELKQAGYKDVLTNIFLSSILVALAALVFK